MSNIFEEVFSKIKTIVKNIYSDEKKIGTVITTIKGDVPATITAMQPFWKASLAAYAALVTAVDDKGLNISVDSTAYADIKAWLTAVHSFSTIIEKDYDDVANALKVTPATTQPVIAPAEPVVEVAHPV